MQHSIPYPGEVNRAAPQRVGRLYVGLLPDFVRNRYIRCDFVLTDGNFW